MISLPAVVLLRPNVVSSEDLDKQLTPKHFESPKNLASKDITVLPRLPKNGVLSPGLKHATTPGGTAYEIATMPTRGGLRSSSSRKARRTLKSNKIFGSERLQITSAIKEKDKEL